MKQYGRRETIIKKTEKRGKATAKFIENRDRNTTKETTLKLN